MSKKIYRTLTEEKMDRIKAELSGLDRWEWNYIKDGVDWYFGDKAAKIKLDDLATLDSYLKRKL